MTSARVRPYQRRRRAPIAITVSVLAAVAVATWSVVFVNASGPSGVESCPVPDAPVGEVLSDDALDAVAPISPASVPVRVLNAGGQRGEASLVAAQLAELGFSVAADPGNDPVFPDGDMECYGQLRFGPAGEAAASTLTLVLPCAELVRDGRGDDTVEVSIGTAFGDFNPGRPARDALERLAEPQGGSDGSANADPNAAEAAPAPPTVDPELIEEARNARC